MANFLHSRGYKNFMSKVYGIGAAVAITGALFKITHLPYANILLTLGLVAEAAVSEVPQVDAVLWHVLHREVYWTTRASHIHAATEERGADIGLGCRIGFGGQRLHRRAGG